MKVAMFQQAPYRFLPEDFEQHYASCVTTPYPELADAEGITSTIHGMLDELVLGARSGFDGVVVTEHGQAAYDITPNPSLPAAILGHTLRTEGLDAALIVLGRSLGKTREPLKIAEEYAMLDVISGGRLVAGLPRRALLRREHQPGHPRGRDARPVQGGLRGPPPGVGVPGAVRVQRPLLPVRQRQHVAAPGPGPASAALVPRQRQPGHDGLRPRPGRRVRPAHLVRREDGRRGHLRALLGDVRGEGQGGQPAPRRGRAGLRGRRDRRARRGGVRPVAREGLPSRSRLHPAALLPAARLRAVQGPPGHAALDRRPRHRRAAQQRDVPRAGRRGLRHRRQPGDRARAARGGRARDSGRAPPGDAAFGSMPHELAEKSIRMFVRGGPPAPAGHLGARGLASTAGGPPASPATAVVCMATSPRCARRSSRVGNGRVRLRVQVARRAGRRSSTCTRPRGPAWDPFLDELAEQHTVYAPTHPGTSARPRATRSTRSATCGTSSSSTTSCSTRSGSQRAARRQLVRRHARLRARRRRSPGDVRQASSLLDPIGLWRDDAPVAQLTMTPRTSCPPCCSPTRRSPRRRRCSRCPRTTDAARGRDGRDVWAMGARQVRAGRSRTSGLAPPPAPHHGADARHLGRAGRGSSRRSTRRSSAAGSRARGSRCSRAAGTSRRWRSRRRRSRSSGGS